MMLKHGCCIYRYAWVFYTIAEGIWSMATPRRTQVLDVAPSYE